MTQPRHHALRRAAVITLLLALSGGYAASTSELVAVEVSLQPSTTTLEISPINEVGDLTFTTTVTPGNVGGTVSIHAAGGEAVVTDAPVFSSIQHYVRHAPPPGSGPYTATFSGTLDYAPSSSVPVAWSDDRTPTATALTVTPASAAPYDPIEFEVKVDPDTWDGSGPMDGVVRLYLDGAFAPWAELPVSGNGVARTTRSFSSAGTPVVHAVYSGDEEYVGSRSADVSITLERIVVATTLELSATEIAAGESVTATVTVDPAPGEASPDPIASLRISSRTGSWFTRSVAIDRATGVGQVTITGDELEPELWTFVARYASNPPLANRFIPSESQPVELRYEPIGPSHTLSIGPSPLYIGDPAVVTAVLDPAPTGGTLELWGTTGIVGQEPFLLASAPAAGTVDFATTAVQGRRFFTRFSGTEELGPSRSAELVPALLGPPTTTLTGPSAWTASPTGQFTFSAGSFSIQPVTFECSIDGAAWFACASPYTTPPLADGPHTFRVRATDANGRVQTNPTQHSWRIDTTPPVITSVSVNGGLATKETVVTIQLGVSDQTLGLYGGGWHRLWSTSPALDGNGRLINPGGPIFITDPTAPFGWNIGHTHGEPLTDGVHKLYLQLADGLGNWSEVAVASVRLDRTAPTLSVTLNGGDVATANARVSVGLCCLAGDPSGIAEIRISNDPSVSGGLLAKARTMAPASAFDWSLVDTAYGGSSVPVGTSATRAVYVQWRDRAGNWSAVAGDTIRLHAVAGDASHPYVDIAGSKFELDIAYVFRRGITSGCGDGRYCPDGFVTRGQMAAFLARALSLPSTSRDYFTDDGASKFQSDINRLAAAGITSGCGGGRYCPDGLVTRGQMAAFLHRALR